jgi:hypothetical protein
MADYAKTISLSLPSANLPGLRSLQIHSWEKVK